MVEVWVLVRDAQTLEARRAGGAATPRPRRGCAAPDRWRSDERRSGSRLCGGPAVKVAAEPGSVEALQ
jgi:hypothetical protein